MHLGHHHCRNQIQLQLFQLHLNMTMKRIMMMHGDMTKKRIMMTHSPPKEGNRYTTNISHSIVKCREDHLEHTTSNVIVNTIVVYSQPLLFFFHNIILLQFLNPCLMNCIPSSPAKAASGTQSWSKSLEFN